MIHANVIKTTIIPNIASIACACNKANPKKSNGNVKMLKKSFISLYLILSTAFNKVPSRYLLITKMTIIAISPKKNIKKVSMCFLTKDVSLS